MIKFIYLLIFAFIISCSNNKEVYWCGDHACADKKEKESYFKKTMIVEVRNLNKNSNDQVSSNEEILSQGKFSKKKNIISETELKEEINIEEQIEIQEKEIAITEQELEEQIEIQEKEIAIKEQELEKQIKIQEKEMVKKEIGEKQEINLSEENKINSKEDSLPTFAKVVVNNDIKSKNFNELVEKILIRNSTRSFPKINDIPK